MKNFKSHFISIADFDRESIMHLIEQAMYLKQNRQTHNKYLNGLSFGLFSSKPSLRTRASFEIGIYELGGKTMFIREDEIGIGTRESYSDIARIISRYFAGFIIRSHNHQALIELSKYSSIPIINALTEQEHPCQALADLLTIYEIFNNIKNIKLTYIGDGNNVCISLMLLSSIVGMHFTSINPTNYAPPKHLIEQAETLAKLYGHQPPTLTNDPSLVNQADILYTDTWISMGAECDTDNIKSTFCEYQLNEKLLHKDIPILHCLPAHKGEEIDEAIFEKNAKFIFEQAENRLHAQKALLVQLIAGKTI